MRSSLVLFIPLLLGSLVLAEESQKEIYTRASAILEQAELAERKNDRDLAWQGYSEALKLFSQAKKKNPDWEKKAVAEKIETCSNGFTRTAPLLVNVFDQSHSETSGLAVKVNQLEETKIDRLKQMDWEKNFLYDRIEPLMIDFIGRVAASRVVAAVGTPEAKQIETAPVVVWGESELGAGLETKIRRRAKQLGVQDLDTVDTDSDGLSDAFELQIGSNPDNSDTDSDGFYDGDEMKTQHSPIDASDHPQIEEVDSYDENSIEWSEQESYLEEEE